MHTKNRLDAMAKKHNGILKTADVVDSGISKNALASFVKERGFEKSSHGIYFDPEIWTDSMFLLQLRCPKTVFSHETALFLQDLTDQEPLSYTVTAKTGYNPSHLKKDGVKVYTVKKELFEVGLTLGLTPFKNPVYYYNRERTICDIIRSRSSIEKQVIHDSLNRYVRCNDKNLHQLIEYALSFHIDRILRQYLEVLL